MIKLDEMENVLNRYFLFFENLGKINVLSKNIIERVLMLMYFPIIISALIFTSTSIITHISIIVMVLLSPLLILPAIYYKKFFLFRNLNLLNYDLVSDQNIIPNSIEFNPVSNKNRSEIYILKDSNYNLIYYNPKKYKTNKKLRDLKTFYNKEAKKYFETLDYKYVENLFFQKKYLSLSERICLFSDLSLIDIKSLLIELNKITNIPQSELSKLFYIYKKSGKYENISMNKLNSSYSQLNRALKS